MSGYPPRRRSVAGRRRRVPRALPASFIDPVAHDIESQLDTEIPRGAMWVLGGGAAIALLTVLGRTAWALGQQIQNSGLHAWQRTLKASWALEPGLAAAIVIGLAAVIATLSVAVVAASWRPPGLPTRVELTAMRTSAALTSASVIAAVCASAVAFLAMGTSVTLGALLSLVALAMAVVASASRDRRDEYMAVIQHDSQLAALQSAQAAANRFLAGYPWLAARRSRLASALSHVWMMLIPWGLVGLLQSALLLGLVLSTPGGTVAFVTSAQFMSALRDWQSFLAAMMGFIAVGWLIGAFALNLLATNDVFIGRILLTLAALCIASPLFSLGAITETTTGFQNAMIVLTSVMPTATVALLLRRGRRGRGAGVAPFNFFYSQLRREVRIAEERYQNLLDEEGKALGARRRLLSP